MSRKVIGRVISSFGLIVLGIFALADMIGLGQSTDVIGHRQLIGVAVGALVIAFGYYVARQDGKSE